MVFSEMVEKKIKEFFKDDPVEEKSFRAILFRSIKMGGEHRPISEMDILNFIMFFLAGTRCEAENNIDDMSKTLRSIRCKEDKDRPALHVGR